MLEASPSFDWTTYSRNWRRGSPVLLATPTHMELQGCRGRGKRRVVEWLRYHRLLFLPDVVDFLE